ncbi:Protein RRNAD1 [Blattella germanica]|nr:Protein RRNAD1 [Blattella germanica]
MNYDGDISYIIKNGLKVIEMYSWLLDSYVLDYFVCDHWEKLPPSWKKELANVEPHELVKFLEHKNSFPSSERVWPLSLLALHKISSQYSIPRRPIQLETIVNNYLIAKDKRVIRTGQMDKNESVDNVNTECRMSLSGETLYLRHPKLQYVFNKHVKPKKQHEISKMAQVTASVAEMENCHYVIDIGSGLGHLARCLAYGYGLKVCCLEAQLELSSQARKLDMELEISVSKALRSAFGLSDDNFSFGIVGLHPCGDLAPILMKLFIECSNAKFINIVGCCYMKLTTGIVSGFNGYPMSKYVSELSHQLSYEAREIACHAIEAYSERLYLGQYENLKIHCYRAALEKILVKYWPHLKHTMIKSIKHSTDLTFSQYVTIAFAKLGLEVPENDVKSEEIVSDLLQWKRVVIFYTLRLMLAPLVETVILLDRLMSLEELDISSRLIPLFDPKLSPRNNILIGRKRS